MKIVLAGDSQLAEESPTRSVTKLAPRLRSLGLEVDTLARRGANSRDLLLQVLPAGVDWVVVSVGTNDAAPWKQVPIDEFESNCVRFLRGASSVRRLVLGPGPVVEHDPVNGRTNELTGIYSDALKRASTETEATFVSLPDIVDERDLADDGVHLSNSAYERIARLVVEITVSNTSDRER